MLANIAVGHWLLNGFEYRADCPMAGCLICGTIFQSEMDRNPDAFASPSRPLALVKQQANELRASWTDGHNKLHTAQEHLALRMSGRWCTPEAAVKLASYGIFSMTDLVLDDEIAHALREAPRAPVNDVEGARY